MHISPKSPSPTRAPAAESFAAAARLAPGGQSYRLMAERLGAVRKAAAPVTK